ncbi:Mth938-like domain-containing protein [Sphingomonas bacterium]|uniref:Mth938-like domain-containing protein n=1 Tax=Sphingomonas bacterium TaxID=1895847 RepID=UPI0015750AA1|nr:Mth938-like domain-containing protein [Sphingomonas bacterium]
MERDARVGGPLVHGFSADGFRVGEAVHRAVLMTVDWSQGWSPPPLAALDVAALEPLLDPLPEFVLLGTGAALSRPPRALVAALEARGTGIEPMDSRAAARAWAVLRGEGRQVAAAFYPLG